MISGFKTIAAASLLWLVSLSASAQGVEFLPITLDEALERAAAEGKPVFLDCYTTWCGPCKQMDTRVFPLREVGDFFNPRFISIKLDMESPEGRPVAQKYGVSSFPTYLILNADGTVRHKVLGAAGPEDFITQVQAGTDPRRSPADLERAFADGTIDKHGLVLYWDILRASQDPKIYRVAEKLYTVLTDEEKMDGRFWELVATLSTNLDHDAFRFVSENRGAFARMYGQAHVDEFIGAAFANFIAPLVYKRKDPEAVARLPRIIEQMDDMQIADRGPLTVMARLAQERDAGDADGFLDILATEFPALVYDHYKSQAVLGGMAVAGEAGRRDRFTRLSQIVADMSASMITLQKQRDTYGMAQRCARLAHEGVRWSASHSLAEALAQSVKENIPVFIYCGPDNNAALADLETGDYFNYAFISFRVDADSDEGAKIRERYGVAALPAYIFVTPHGDMQHMLTGELGAAELVERIQAEITDPAKALGLLDAQYRTGNRTPQLLSDYLDALRKVNSPKAGQIAEELAAAQEPYGDSDKVMK